MKLKTNIENVKKATEISRNLKIGVIVAKFNSKITNRLKQGAMKSLKKNKVLPKQVTFIEAPGAFDIPFIANHVLSHEPMDGIVAIGAVIRGDTYHFEVVSNESARGIGEVSIHHDIPITNCILTCNNEKEALLRSGGELGNKGMDAMDALLEILQWMDHEKAE